MLPGEKSVACVYTSSDQLSTEIPSYLSLRIYKFLIPLISMDHKKHGLKAAT